jgi:5'-nucleotidase
MIEILITNDDGIEAKGLRALIEVVKPMGKVTVVAPAEPQSGMSHAITVKQPLRVERLKHSKNYEEYICYGTPVDCVKLAMNQILQKRPDLLLSGINHGSNSATSIIYSGTMAAALEGCVNEISSIGFSLLNLSPEADFTASKFYIEKIIRRTIEESKTNKICLNVNIPNLPPEQIKGIKACRQNLGFWQEEFDKRTDPHGKNYFWLTGEFLNTEPEAKDTDEWALSNHYISVVPVKVDLTCYTTLKDVEKWKF